MPRYPPECPVFEIIETSDPVAAPIGAHFECTLKIWDGWDRGVVIADSPAMVGVNPEPESGVVTCTSRALTKAARDMDRVRKLGTRLWDCR
jgi:hypothetical protein